MDDIYLAVTAEHEAAHAAVYLSQDVEISLVDAGDDPITVVAHPRPRPVLDDAVVAMAGPLVEARYREFDFAREVAELSEFLEEEGLAWGDSGWAWGEQNTDLAIFTKHPNLLSIARELAKIKLELFADLHREITEALLEAPDHRLTGKDLDLLPLAGPMQRRAREVRAAKDASNS